MSHENFLAEFKKNHPDREIIFLMVAGSHFFDLNGPNSDHDYRGIYLPSLKEFYEGEGKYTGMLGGVIVRRKNGYESKVGGGFSDWLRHEIWHNQDRHLTKTIEIHYLEDTPAGDFRHARFKKFRPDKD
jgi:hypothetical protein